MNLLRKIKKSFIIKFVNCFLKGTHFYKIKRHLLNRCSGIVIGKDTKIVGPILLPALSEVKIGANCWVGHHFSIEGNGNVVIGNNCDFAPHVTMVTGSHEIGDSNRRAGKGFNGRIEIGDGSWIGTRTIILPNIIVGSGIVIGAGSLVTKLLQPNKVYGGCPAKEIKNLD